METPQPVRRKRPSTDSTNTRLSSVFDGDSLLSSSASPASDNDGTESEWEVKTLQDRSLPSNSTQDSIFRFHPNDYATAGSQRPQRKGTLNRNYTNSSTEASEQTLLEAEVQEQPSLPTYQTRKRKEQPLAIKSTPQPPQKKRRTCPAKNAPGPKVQRSHAEANNEQRSSASSRQLPKRKFDTTVPDSLQPLTPKKAKTTTAKTRTKAQSSPPEIVGDLHAIRRVTRSRKPAPTDPISPTPKSTKLVLKFRNTRETHVKSSSQSSLPSETQGEALFPSLELASQVDSTSTQDTRNTFESTSSQSSKDDQEQFAQSTLAPVPASSQDAGSFANSQSVQPAILPQEENLVVLHSSQVADEVDLNIVSPIRFMPFSRSQDDAKSTPSVLRQSSQQQHGLDETQPTLLLDQPWNPPSPTTLKLPELSQAQTQIDSDVVSNATTEDEIDLESSHQSTACLEEQHQLYKIADKLFANRNSVVAKPSPAGRPEVWADGRQELCETLHYFRSYQSACYCTGGFARGFMFDKVAHVRDYIDCNVIISRAGGGLIKHKDSGEMRTGGDQSEDTPIVQGLRNCIKHYNPVVVITGIDNPHIPSQPPHQYCVLDYFKPTNIWVEKSGDSKILRYRFEKLNTEKDSWWRPKDEQDPITLGTLDPPFENSCECCGVKSTQIYLNGWMCLQPSCIAFWRIIDDHRLGPYKVSYEPEEASLTYDPRFLKQKTAWPNDQHYYPLGSDGPELSVHSIPGEDTSQAYWSGIVCPDCGRCNSRLKWMGWGCLNPSCSFKREPPHTLIPAATLRQPFWPITNSYTMSRDTHDPIIDVKVSFAHGYRINRYSIPDLEGFITHMIANKTVLKEPGGPDAMFEELQRTDIDLQRRAMPNGQLKGESYCRQFTVNYGMPYKFIAATASHSFEHAARPINATRSRLNWAAKHLLSQEEPGKSTDAIAQDWKPKEFNEVLALGYFESQKINYHDDGEFGLGPTIATLSLGAPGTMRIRMKARHYHGASNAGVYDDARPLPGCKQFDARAALQPSLEALKASDPKAYRARLKQVPKELGLKTTGNAKDVLRMELGHGDVVVMHGAEVQKYYEHAVEHAGKLRFALTCRYIDEGSLKEGDKPGYVVGPDCGDYDGSKLC